MITLNLLDGCGVEDAGGDAEESMEGETLVAVKPTEERLEEDLER